LPPQPISGITPETVSCAHQLFPALAHLPASPEPPSRQRHGRWERGSWPATSRPNDGPKPSAAHLVVLAKPFGGRDWADTERRLQAAAPPGTAHPEMPAATNRCSSLSTFIWDSSAESRPVSLHRQRGEIPAGQPGDLGKGI